MEGHSGFNTLLRAGILTAALAAMEACASGPPSDKTEDHAVTARVAAALEQYPALETPNHVSVQTVGDVVYLRGLVSTPYQKRLAQEVAAQAAPGLHIVNIIGVENNR
jgi:osmotically-inducible protein OsmY